MGWAAGSSQTPGVGGRREEGREGAKDGAMDALPRMIGEYPVSRGGGVHRCRWWGVSSDLRTPLVLVQGRVPRGGCFFRITVTLTPSVAPPAEGHVTEGCCPKGSLRPSS